MSAIEYLSGNSLMAYPFKDGRATNPALELSDDTFLDALFVVFDKSLVKRPYISNITTIQNTIALEVSDVVSGDTVGTVSIPFDQAVSHLGNTLTSFFYWEAEGWSLKLIFGPGIEKLRVLGKNVNFSPEHTEFCQAVVIDSVPSVSSLEFKSYPEGEYSPVSVHKYISGEEVIMSNGTNTDFNFASPETMYLDIKRGNGKGLHDPCNHGAITDIHTINQVTPDSSGNLFITPDDCYSFKLLTYNDTQLYSFIPQIESNYGDFTTPIPASGGQAGYTAHFNAIQDIMGGHGIVMQNNCQPKCPPQNLNAFAEYLNRVTDAAAELYKVVNNEYETYGVGTISGSIFTAGTFCGGALPVNWANGICSGKFIKYFHEGRTITVQYSSNTSYTFTILEVLDEYRVLLTEVPPTNANLLPFKVGDFGVKNKLNEVIIANNQKLVSKNVPSIDINYSTVEAYNASQAYGTFITAIIVVYNPSSDALQFGVTWQATGTSVIPSSIKVKSSNGEINYGGTQGVLACKDYATFEAIFFIPCSQDVANPNEGAVTFHVVDSNTGIDIENSPKTITAASASCVSAASAVAYATAIQNVPFSYTVENSNALSYSFSGDIPSWLNIDPSAAPASGNLFGTPTGTTSHSYTISITINETGGATEQTLIIDYIAIPNILKPLNGSTLRIYPPDTTNRTYTSGAPLLPITANNSPTSYTFTGIPPGLRQSGNGLVGQITIGSSPAYPITYEITATATNEAGTSDPVTVTVELNNEAITTPTAYQNTPFCYSIIVDSDVVSQSVTSTLPSWLSFDPTLNFADAVSPVCNFYGTNNSYTPYTQAIVVRQNLSGGTYRLVQYLIPYVSTPSITYPQNNTNFSIYPPDFGNTEGANTTFTSTNPLLKVLATNSPTSFTATGLPSGLSIDNSGNIIGTISASAGVFNVSVTAANSLGSSQAVYFGIGLYNQLPTISAYQGQALCYKFPTLSNATSFNVTGNIPPWLKVATTLKTSCHISSNKLTDSQSQSFNISVAAVINGANLTQNYILNYVALPQITSPTQSQQINISFAGVAAPTYTAQTPLLKIQATNNPSSYSASGLPSGLTIDNSGNVVGQITGNPGNYPVTFTAINNAGSSSVTVNIKVSNAPIISNAYKNQQYCYSLGSLGDVTSYSYTGTVPSWLTFDWAPNVQCTLSGTPTGNTSEVYNFTVVGQTAGGQVSLDFELRYLVAPTITYPVAGTVFNITPPDYGARLFTTSNPLFQIAASNLPTSFNASGFYSNTLRADSTTGAIVGTVGSRTSSANIPITLTATNGAGTSAPVTVYVTISSTPIVINLDGSSNNICYAFDVSDNPSGLSITGLPSWLTFNYPAVSGCNISGTVPAGITQSTSYNLVLTRQYGIGSLQQNITLNIVKPPVITRPYSGSNSALQNTYNIAPPDFNNRVYTSSSPLLTVAATNSPASYAAQGLPPGLSIDSQGRVIGGPVTAAGQYPVQFTATNSVGTSSPASCLIEVLSAVETTDIAQGILVCNRISTKDGATRYTLNGSLPSGITFNGTPGTSCNFSGVPLSSNLPGNYSVDITSIYPGGSSTSETTFNLKVPPRITTTTSRFRFLPSQYTVGSPYTDTNPLIAISYVNDPAAFTASGLPVGLEITCLGNIIGSLTSAAKGVYTVTVQASNSAGVSAPYTFTLDLSQISPTINWSTPSSISYGTELSSTQLNAHAVDGSGNSISGTYTYTPSAGTVLGAGNRTLTVLFTPDNTLDVASTTKAVNLTVNKYTPQIVWEAPTGITYGTGLSSTQLNASALDINLSSVPGNFIYSPGAGAILNGGTQTLTVTFNPTDTANFNNATKTTSIVVSPATPSITWNNPAAINYGTALSNSQLNAQAYIQGTSTNVPGTFTYSPAAGTVLSAGERTLSVTFTPINSSNYVQTPVTKSVSITVNKATPVVSWPSPTAITYGTALSNTQLNAQTSGGVQGTFVYTPASGAILPTGTNTLNVVFNPSDSNNYNSATASTTITVNKATPQIVWTNPASIPYGTQLTSTQLNAYEANSLPGVFTYTPAAGVIPNGGNQTLSVTFTPTDLTNYLVARASVTISVTPVTPTINWGAIAPITYGTALSSTQLNAAVYPTGGAGSTQAPGTLTYTPGLNTILSSGTTTLSVAYAPSNPANYNSTSATNSIVVNKVIPTLAWASPQPINYLTALSAAQLNPTAVNSRRVTIPGAFTYTASGTKVSNQNIPVSLGTVLDADTYVITATFTPTDTSNYETGLTVSCTLVVNKTVITFEWASLSKSAYYSNGAAYSSYFVGPSVEAFDAYVNVPTYVNGTLTQVKTTIAGQKTSDPQPSYQILTNPVDSSGQGQAVYGGAYFVPTDQNNFVNTPRPSDYKRVSISKCTPVINWVNPADVAKGTALTSTQLNATVTNCGGQNITTQGTLTYNPPVGTVINSTTALTVTFTPTNTVGYNIVTKTVDIKTSN